MDGEFREIELIKVEEAASRVIGKVMFCRVVVGSLLDHFLFRNVCLALLLVLDL